MRWSVQRSRAYDSSFLRRAMFPTAFGANIIMVEVARTLHQHVLNQACMGSLEHFLLLEDTDNITRLDKGTPTAA